MTAGDDPVVAQMIAAAALSGLLPLAKDASLDVSLWWATCEPHWRRDPAYHANVAEKAERYGKEWVRAHMAEIHAYWKNALQLTHLQEFLDAGEDF